MKPIQRVMTRRPSSTAPCPSSRCESAGCRGGPNRPRSLSCQLIMVEPGRGRGVRFARHVVPQAPGRSACLGPHSRVSHEALRRCSTSTRRCSSRRVHGATRPALAPSASAAGHTTAYVGHLDVITVGGFRCSSATRTILDLAYLGVPRIAWRRRSTQQSVLATPRFLCSEATGRTAWPRRYGVDARPALPPTAEVETPLERAFLRLIRRHQLRD